MIQRLIAIGVMVTGGYFFLNDSAILGASLFIFGGAVLNGASHGVLLSFHFGDGDGGGD